MDARHKAEHDGVGFTSHRLALALMCGLCGLLGGAHWTDESVGGDALPARQAKLRRVALLNRVLRHYRLRVDDWQGAALSVRGPTGRTELADSLADLWPKAEAAAGRTIDPLDPDLLESMAGGEP